MLGAQQIHPPCDLLGAVMPKVGLKKDEKPFFLDAEKREQEARDHSSDPVSMRPAPAVERFSQPPAA